MKNTYYVRRDGFARTELRRESMGIGECAWCGQVRRTYCYTTERDGAAARNPLYVSLLRARRFCNLGCFGSFYGD